MAKTVVIALATRDFDPTEAAVPWKVLGDAGHEVLFATADGRPAACDPLMLEGGAFFGTIKATPENADTYRAMAASDAFAHPMRFAELDPAVHDLLILPGGHAPGMRQYLEDTTLQAAVARVLSEGHPLGSICHGAVVLARARTEDGGHAIAGRKITGLPKTMELGAWIITAPTMGSYFRTYPETVQDEAKRALGADGEFLSGPLLPAYGRPFTVRDGNLVTARWPGDALAFAEQLLELIGGAAA
jgi:putative intracellular protease/amidase